MLKIPSVKAFILPVMVSSAVVVSSLTVPALADVGTGLVAARAAYDAKMSAFGYGYAMQIRSFLSARSYALADGSFTASRRQQIADGIRDYAGRLDTNYAQRDVLVDAYNREGMTAERDAFMARFEAAQQLHRADLEGLRQSILTTPLSTGLTASIPLPAPWPLPQASLSSVRSATPTMAPVLPVESVVVPPVPTFAEAVTFNDSEAVRAFNLVQAANRQRDVFSQELFLRSRDLFGAPLPNAVLRARGQQYLGYMYDRRNVVIDAYNQAGMTAERDRFIAEVEARTADIRAALDRL